ncbi:MAG: ATP-binding cassette domain-containing protein [Ruminococcaceae bacterium]|nr:ATP-binding cassette domain-containing protein [Oscillospiraceae bacterium]
MVNFKINNLSFTYPDSKSQALKNINLTINQGEFIVICGRSGSGKSTLLRMLKPELTPHGTKEGEIKFFGSDEFSLRDSAEKIGFLLQNTEYQAVTHSVRTELAFGLENLGLDSKTIRLRIAEISAYFSLESIIDKKISELSGGQKQMVCLASILAMHPDVIIFDEPSSQLDPMTAETFLNTIHKLYKENGITVIITEHRLENLIPVADRVIVMDKGKIISDTSPRDIPAELAADDDLISSAVPIAMRLHTKLKLTSPVPLNVAEGRQMLSRLFSEKPKHKELEADSKDNINESAVEVKDLWYAYDKSRYVLNGLDLKIKKGSFFALLGANGAGKTTALSLISGLLPCKQGKIKLFGKPINKYKDDELYGKTIGVLPQKCESLFGGYTVREDLDKSLSKSLPDKKARKERIEEVAAFCEITKLLDSHPYDISGGEMQRAALCMVLLKEPQILLLDEPTKGMDNLFKKQFASKIKELNSKGITVIMVSHDTEFCAEYCDECALIFDGMCALQEESRKFFSKNFFYTTTANKIAREFFPNAVTERQVLEHCRQNLVN